MSMILPAVQEPQETSKHKVIVFMLCLAHLKRLGTSENEIFFILQVWVV